MKCSTVTASTKVSTTRRNAVKCAAEPSRRQATEKSASHRRLFLSQAVGGLGLFFAEHSLAEVLSAPQRTRSEDETNPLIKDLLEKSEANRDRRDRERLDDYNKRNFTDYFNLTKDSKVMTPETRAQIEKWLQEHQ